jgi:hypothetical protein
MLVKTNGVVFQVLMRLPLWLPISIGYVRIGNDTHSYAKIYINKEGV